MSGRRLLFSQTAKDFEFQTFCTGGNGGQHRNAKQNGVRVIHKASGARAEHRDGRDQGQNRKAAFEKLVETKEWKLWHRMEVARQLGQVKEAEEAADRAMKAENIKVELKDAQGKWIKEIENEP